MRKIKLFSDETVTIWRHGTRTFSVHVHDGHYDREYFVNDATEAAKLAGMLPRGMSSFLRKYGEVAA